MTLSIRSISLSALSAAALLGTNAASASLLGADNASDPAYDGGWNTGTNGGTGFGPWTLGNSAGGGFGGGFITTAVNNENDIGVGPDDESFGVFGNTGGDGFAERSFNAGLTVGQSFSITMDNSSVFNGGRVGFALTNAAGDNLLEYSFFGGATNYSVGPLRDSGTTPAFNTTGQTVTITVTDADSYIMTIDELSNGPSIDHTVVGDLFANADQVLGGVRLFNLDGGPDVFFNNFELIPEPASATLIAAGGLLMLRRRRA